MMLYFAYTRLAFALELLLHAAMSQYTSTSPNATPSNPFATVSKAEPIFKVQSVTTKDSGDQKNSSSCHGNCSSLPYDCYDRCVTNLNCTYGKSKYFNCTVKEPKHCSGPSNVSIKFQCRMCYLTIANKEHSCSQSNTTCKVNATPRQRVKAQCKVHENVFCLGKREFSKMEPCNWSSGYSWTVSLVLSITLGGFGVDRFYLGYWKEGLGKFFSFGGLGVWTLIDAILIGTGYLGPSDGSFYVR